MIMKKIKKGDVIEIKEGNGMPACNGLVIMVSGIPNEDGFITIENGTTITVKESRYDNQIVTFTYIEQLNTWKITSPKDLKEIKSHKQSLPYTLSIAV